MRQRKVPISMAIVLIIGLHAVPVLHSGERTTLWPFLHWAMYKEARPAGPIEVHKRRIIAVTVKGVREEVTPHLLGLSISMLGRLYLRPLWARDSAAARQLFGRLNRQRQDRFVEFHLESETYTVTDTGMVKRDNPAITFRDEVLNP